MLTEYGTFKWSLAQHMLVCIWCWWGRGHYTVNVKLVLHLEVASSFGQGRLHSDTEGAVIIWLPILVVWGGDSFEL